MNNSALRCLAFNNQARVVDTMDKIPGSFVPKSRATEQSSRSTSRGQKTTEIERESSNGSWPPRISPHEFLGVRRIVKQPERGITASSSVERNEIDPRYNPTRKYRLVSAGPRRVPCEIPSRGNAAEQARKSLSISGAVLISQIIEEEPETKTEAFRSEEVS